MKKIAVTLGDPGGIGPEVFAKALHTLAPHPHLFRIYGSPHCLQRACQQSQLSWNELQQKHRIEWVEVCEPFVFPQGTLSPQGAWSQTQAIQKALEDWPNQKWDAWVTGPIHKNAIEQCNLPYKGHTDWLAETTQRKDKAVMMLAGPKLRVVPATIHIPLQHVAQSVTAELLEHVIRTTLEGLQHYFRIPNPSLAICGLNPHAGDNGQIGKEELLIMEPLLQKIRKEYPSVQGPFPADSLFHFAKDGRYSAIIGMYHDQVLTPFKMLHFEDGINLSLGLPFLRTSVDHGTAYDLAGKGIANEKSMLEALEFAIQSLNHSQA